MNEAAWPKGASCAFAFCFDLDGDTIWKNKIHKIPGGEAFIKSRSVGLYGPRKGADHLLRLMKEYGFKSTFFVPGDIADRYPDVMERIVEAGHEIAHHGYYHEDSYGDTLEEQLEVIEKSQRAFERVTGRRAVGFRFSGDVMPELRDIVYSDANTLYASNSGLAIERCEFLTAGGRKTRAVGVPCREELDDYIQTVFNHYPPIPSGLPRIAPYEDVLSNFIRELEGAERFGNAVTPAFHPQISGAPGKSLVIDKMCRYIASNPKIWCASCEDIALWWRENEGKN